VLLKPNWVHHENRSGEGLDSLITHTSVIEAVLHYVLKAAPSTIIIGDAPIQGCDFAALVRQAGIESLGRLAETSSTEISVRDFRCVRLTERTSSQIRNTDRGYDQYVLVDLASESSLEPISEAASEFRVTMYDPRDMRPHHGPGRHRYLVAREVLEADVVFNLPKLKTHKKAGLTGALKNVVGINGHKEFLPHHRKGGSADGGDCYPGSSRLKRFAEEMLDISNRSSRRGVRYVLPRLGRLAVTAGTYFGGDDNLTGSWHGNDTVWRTCLDLQRVLHYARVDGSLSDTQQRTVVSLTDAIVAGEGNGPLAPSPVGLGLLSLSTSTAAVEWVHALIMGLDPERIPLLLQTLQLNRMPLIRVRPDELVIRLDGTGCSVQQVYERTGRPFRMPQGWRGACEQTVKLATA